MLSVCETILAEIEVNEDVPNCQIVAEESCQVDEDGKVSRLMHPQVAAIGGCTVSRPLYSEASISLVVGHRKRGKAILLYHFDELPLHFRLEIVKYFNLSLRNL